jgi:hypothetical protein
MFASVADLHGKSSVVPQYMSSKVKRAEPVASHSVRWFCGRRFIGLGFDLLCFIFLSGDGGVVFEPLTALGNGNRLGVVRESL